MYTKLFADILQSSIWAEDAETCKVWITLLALANPDGLVRATAPGIAHEARVSLGKTRRALALFESPDPDSRTPDNEGRRIERTDGGYLVLNYRKYREMQDEERRRTLDRERARRYRERRSSAQSVTPERDDSVTRHAKSQQAEAEAEKKTCAPPVRASGFETFWKAYPRKRSKGEAEKAWKKLHPDADLLRAILAAIERANRSKDWQKDDGAFIPYPASWLNAKGWEDELGAAPAPIDPLIYFRAPRGEGGLA